jgi:hypothetical protein
MAAKILAMAEFHRNVRSGMHPGGQKNGNVTQKPKKSDQLPWTDVRPPQYIAGQLEPYTRANPLIGVVGKGSHSIIFKTANPEIVAKVEYQEGPGKLALLAREQGWMRQFLYDNHLAHSLDVLWNVSIKDEPGCVYNVVYMPYYPLSIHDLVRFSSPVMVATQLKEAIAQLHKHDLVHRDIHPNNIRGMANGCLVLIDFGLTMKVDNKPVSKKKLPPVGTDGFISESVLAGNPYTFRDDYVSASKVIHSLIKPQTFMDEPCPMDIQQFMGLLS